MNTIAKMGTCVPKMAGMGGCYCGRRGLPAAAIAQMYADYLRLGSLSKVADLHGRTRQAMFDIFKRRGLKLNSRNFLPAIDYQGRKYTSQKTCGRHRYLRDTVSRTKMMYLHHVVWVENNGPIPPGHKVAFKDGNHLNIDIDNLELLTNSEQVRKYASKGQNQFTKQAPARLAALLQGTGRGLAGLRRGR